MCQPGLAEVDRAKADGRWGRAYAGPTATEVPADLADALAEKRQCQGMFDILTSQTALRSCTGLRAVSAPRRGPGGCGVRLVCWPGARPSTRRSAPSTARPVPERDRVPEPVPERDRVRSRVGAGAGSGGRSRCRCRWLSPAAAGRRYRRTTTSTRGGSPRPCGRPPSTRCPRRAPMVAERLASAGVNRCSTSAAHRPADPAARRAVRLDHRAGQRAVTSARRASPGHARRGRRAAFAAASFDAVAALYVALPPGPAVRCCARSVGCSAPWRVRGVTTRADQRPRAGLGAAGLGSAQLVRRRARRPRSSAMVFHGRRWSPGTRPHVELRTGREPPRFKPARAGARRAGRPRRAAELPTPMTVTSAATLIWARARTRG